ncbi:phytoene dehydrogenase [Xylaria sp. CBS 124048]|nr:phytoene dehydrogenase [Xylaria sp. CBS 124048]
MESQSPKKVVVIGAGAGGISTAARLAKAGLSVTVLEKNSFTGGRCSLLTHAGHRFDQGPSLLLLPKLFHQAFHDLDTSLSAEGVELLKCPTNYSIYFNDASPPFELTTDLARMKSQIEHYEGKDGFVRYLSWLQESHAHYELSVSEVLSRNFTSIWQLAMPKFVLTGLKLHPLHTIWQRASLYFWSERLRRVFTFATMYMGMSPFDAPATYSLLQYTELAEGIWYPRGGFHTILAALQRVGERYGVTYRLNTPVSQVLVDPNDGKTVKGVQLSSGETIPADIVVVNADLVYAYNHLFPQLTPSVKKYSESLRDKPGSCSSISFYWSLNRKVPELNTHNIFLADEYRDSFDAIFDRHTLPSEPSFYVNVPSRIDPTAAPPGCDSIIALVPVGHLPSSHGFPPTASASASKTQPHPQSQPQDWPALISQARQAVLQTIEARTNCAPLHPSITHELINDPPTWQAKFNLDKGSILGLSHSFFNVLAFRPATRAHGLRNAYFVGASTHPGTGVPIVLAGSKITAEQVLDDLRLPVPWPRRRPRDARAPDGPLQSGKLDQIRPPLVETSKSVLITALFAFLALILSSLLVDVRFFGR